MQDSDRAITPERKEIHKQSSISLTSTRADKGPDWLAIGTVLFIAALFAIVARLNAQPAASLMPIAALSATGCGLLVTAIRKVRTFQRPGLMEACIAGFGLGLFQFLAALTYPNVIQILGIDPAQKNQFIATWILVIVCTMVFSLVGAAIGHLAFAPFVPPPNSRKAKLATSRGAHKEREEYDPDNDDDDEKTDSTDDIAHDSDDNDEATDRVTDVEDETSHPKTAPDGDESITHPKTAPEVDKPVAHSDTNPASRDMAKISEESSESEPRTRNKELDTRAEAETVDKPDNVEAETRAPDTVTASETEDETETVAEPIAASTPSLLQIIMAVFLLGLSPTIIAYVFSAAYDYVMSLFQLSSGPYPTLRILSALLPWQIPIPVTFSGVNESLITVLLWRVPLFLGNPTRFDFQALEPVVFNGLALALLLLLSQGQRIRNLSNQAYTRINLATFLILEALFGLVIVVPANLWIQRGVQGLLQLQSIVVPIRSLELLDTTSFLLNFVTAPLLCVILGLVLWSQRERASISS